MEKSYRSQPLQILHSPVQCPLLRQWQLNYAPAILLMPNVPRSVPDFLLLQKCHFPFSLLPLLGLAGFPLQSPAARHGLLGLEPKPLSGVLKASNVKKWILSHCPQSRTRNHLCVIKGQLTVQCHRGIWFWLISSTASCVHSEYGQFYIRLGLSQKRQVQEHVFFSLSPFEDSAEGILFCIEFELHFLDTYFKSKS